MSAAGRPVPSSTWEGLGRGPSPGKRGSEAPSSVPPRRVPGRGRGGGPGVGGRPERVAHVAGAPGPAPRQHHGARVLAPQHQRVHGGLQRRCGGTGPQRPGRPSPGLGRGAEALQVAGCSGRPWGGGRGRAGRGSWKNSRDPAPTPPPAAIRQGRWVTFSNPENLPVPKRAWPRTCHTSPSQGRQWASPQCWGRARHRTGTESILWG